MPKRSVYDVDATFSPLQILQFAKSCYDEPYISQDDRLEHAAAPLLQYLGGFRYGELLEIYASQFIRRKSLEKRDFVVVESALIEKSGGRRRNVAIEAKDPLFVPVVAHLRSLLPQEKVVTMAQSTAWSYFDRVSSGAVWPHLLKAMRDRFLAVAFDKLERKKIIGWSTSAKKSKGGKWYGDSEDVYAGLNWMWYADRLARLNESYWSNEEVPADVRLWLDQLSARP
ncbi:MAG: hypothetical protein KGO96_13095 [Elusimicrobia bacterium]|nr:hypothetical protein [Elusimicrobiota bacterium]MDE2426830.1 hypothetical protein [Elusimicrobiota bacterium]